MNPFVITFIIIIILAVVIVFAYNNAEMRKSKREKNEGSEEYIKRMHKN